jgi:hypothetical protein
MEQVKIQNDAVLQACLSQVTKAHRADLAPQAIPASHPFGSEEGSPSNQASTGHLQSLADKGQSNLTSPFAAAPISTRESYVMKHQDAVPYHGTSSSLTYLNTQHDGDTVSILLMKLFVKKVHFMWITANLGAKEYALLPGTSEISS